MGDNSEMNAVTIGDSGEIDTVHDSRDEAMSFSFTPEQIALFELCHENGYNFLVD